MDFDCRCSVLDELDQHGEISEFANIADYELDLFEDLQDVNEEELGSICWRSILNKMTQKLESERLTTTKYDCLPLVQCSGRISTTVPLEPRS